MSSSVMRVVLVFSTFMPVALGCGGATEPHVALGAIQFTPPSTFPLWWRLTESCSALNGDFASVQWYVVPNTTTVTYQGQQVDAYWISNPDRIVLADARRNDPMIVRHEMLHALRHANGHPRDAFLQACGGVVACDGSCALEAGSYDSPGTAAPVLKPSDVTPRVDVLAPLPAEVSDTGAVAVLITITNPRPEPVWVKLSPRESGDLQYPTFGIVADYDDPARIATLAVEWSQRDLIPLGTGERKHYVWTKTLPRGRYGVLGYFNVDSLPRQVISIGQ